MHNMDDTIHVLGPYNRIRKKQKLEHLTPILFVEVNIRHV